MVATYVTATGVALPAVTVVTEALDASCTSDDTATVAVAENELSDVSGSLMLDVTAKAPDTSAVVAASMVYEMARSAAAAPPATLPASVHVSVGDGDAGVHVHPVPAPDTNVVPAGRSHVTWTPDASLGPALLAVTVVTTGVELPASVDAGEDDAVTLKSPDVVTVTFVVMASSLESGSSLSDAAVPVAATVPGPKSESTVYEMTRSAAEAPLVMVPVNVHVSVGDGDAGVHVHPVPAPDTNVVPAGRSHVTVVPAALLGPALLTV